MTATRHFMQLAYRGAPFSGWQVQPGRLTVQGRLEEALACLLGEEVNVVGAGRTDTGVNARMMIAHFDTHAPLRAGLSCEALAARLNGMLAPDIVVDRIWPVAGPELHARFSATARTYRYFAATRRSPFVLGSLAWPTRRPLNFEAMNRGAEALLGTHDFTSFSKLHTQVKTNICTVSHALWTPVADAGPMAADSGLWQFEITADRFLRNMVRAVVGTLVEVGRGKHEPSWVAEVMESRNRCAAGTSMPAEALFLWSIAYEPGVLSGGPQEEDEIEHGGSDERH